MSLKTVYILRLSGNVLQHNIAMTYLIDRI